MSKITFPSQESYINAILPTFLSNDAAKAYLKAFCNVSNEEIDRLIFALREGQISGCDDDALDAHMQSGDLLISPFETKTQERQYLEKKWPNVYKRIGSAELLLDELKRFGFPNARIFTWNDLILSGVKSAFGGGPTIFPGLDANGGMGYIAISPTVQVNISQDIIGPNQPLSVVIGTTGISATITIYLQTDNIGSPISTPRDIVHELDAAGAGSYIFYFWTGTGFGKATSAISQTLPNIYYTFYFIDLYEPNVISDPILWNDNTITTTKQLSGPSFLAWKKLGSQPKNFPTETPIYVDSIWGSNANNIWAHCKNDGNLYFYNGVNWTATSVISDPNDRTTRMTGTDASNIWLGIVPNSVIPNGYVYHYNGVNWQKIDIAIALSGSLKIYGVFCLNNVNLWVCGRENGVITRAKIAYYNGLSWTDQSPIVVGTDTFISVWGFGASDVWSCTTNELYYYNGLSWVLHTGPIIGPNEEMVEIWGISSSDLYILGKDTVLFTGILWHYDGLSWSVVTTPTFATPYDIRGFSSNNIWIQTINSQLHYDGISWKQYVSPTQVVNNTIESYISTLGPNQLVASTSYGVIHYDQFVDGLQTTSYTSVTDPMEGFLCIDGLNSNYVFAAGRLGLVYYYNGTSWQVIQSPSMTANIFGVHVVAINNIWFVGENGLCYQYNGTTFVDYSFPAPDDVTYYDIWFADANEGYCVGQGSRLGRWNGTAWTISTVTFPTAPANPNLTCIDGHKRSVDAKALICFAGSNQICVSDEATATTYFRQPIMFGGYNDIHIDNRDFIYLTASVNQITTLRVFGIFVATNSSISIAAGTENLKSVAWLSPNDIRIVSDKNLYHFDGNAWTLIYTTPIDLLYTKLWAANYNDIFFTTFSLLGAPPDALIYRFSPTFIDFPSLATGKLWNQKYYWDGQPPTENFMEMLRRLIRKYSPTTMSPRFVRIANKMKLTAYPIGEEYEEDYNGNINGPYLFSYLVP